MGLVKKKHFNLQQFTGLDECNGQSSLIFRSPASSATSTDDISVYARQHGQLTDVERDTLLYTDLKPSEKHGYKKTQFGKQIAHSSHPGSRSIQDLCIV
ncbi:hypothetical protein DPMN_108056 [Dreissena polymorpha]|uniref:Uncharacterized protein n=1 Tax=Dreissena polymorpha TaxID=45954 RepID=A0A9D4QLM2_DREPO|nr:hypothetical protein DPMN_108056 [Dreissena polymorpha]